MKTNRDQKPHHHHRMLSIPKEVNKKNNEIINTNKNEENNKTKNKNTNVSIQDTQKKDQKHRHHRHNHRSSSMVSSQKEKNYLKYKLENFGKDTKKDKDKKEKRFKISDIDINMPKNIDKNNEKYFKPKPHKSEKNKEKDKTKKSNIESNNTYINESSEKKNETNQYEGSNYNENKDKSYNYEGTNQYLEENNNNINNEKNNENKKNNKSFRNSMVNIRNNKIKEKYFQNNDYDNPNDYNNNIMEEENNFNKGSYKYKDSNKQLKEEKNKEMDLYNNYLDEYLNQENPRKQNRKRSMKISSKYSEKMESQIRDEREKIMKEKEYLEKRKDELYHLEEIQKKESYAQEHFIKSFMSNLSPFIDYGRISSRLPGGYTFLQSKLIYLDLSCTEEEFNYIYNKKNFYKSKNAKDLCRRGIPIKYMKIFFKKLLNLENYKENYTLKYSMIIKDIDPNFLGDYVPYFCGKEKKKLKEILPVHYLNEEGIIQLKVIMWLISDLVPKIEYCPLLVKICSILLVFLEKEEVYEAMRTLIEMNYRPSEIFKLRWHFRFSIFENNKLIDSIRRFLETESENMKKLFIFFIERGLDPGMLIKDFCEGLFLKYLNFYGILRFISIFIYEGSKFLYRFTYGLLNYLYEEKFEDLKNNKNELIYQIREIICGITDYKKIIQDSFNLQVNRTNNGYIKNKFGEDLEDLEKPFEENSVCNTETENDINIKFKSDNYTHNDENNYLNEFYLPSIEPTSNILSSKEIIQLWSKLPLEMKKSNLATIYSLSKKKVNMKSIIELSRKYPEDFPILILIETEQNELFGAIIPRMLLETEDKEYIELDKCYLVVFRPKLCIYKDNYSKGINMLCCNKKGLWFCKQDVGDLFYIDGTLSEGKTCKNNTYFGQVNLTRKDHFLVKDFEIIVFVQNNI